VAIFDDGGLWRAGSRAAVEDMRDKRAGEGAVVSAISSSLRGSAEGSELKTSEKISQSSKSRDFRNRIGRSPEELDERE